MLGVEYNRLLAPVLFPRRTVTDGCVTSLISSDFGYFVCRARKFCTALTDSCQLGLRQTSRICFPLHIQPQLLKEHKDVQAQASPSHKGAVSGYRVMESQCKKYKAYGIQYR